MSYLVIDANIAVKSILSMTESLNAFWEKVDQKNLTPCAPRLWLSETASAIRALVFQKAISANDAEEVLRTIYGLRIEIIDEDEELSLRALEWAGKLSQSKAYDAFYIALAEKLVADFWTADERLYNQCRKNLKLSWVHWVGEL
jgi:predicted nucleic acid-binding protein